eukprot:279078_1
MSTWNQRIFTILLQLTCIIHIVHSTIPQIEIWYPFQLTETGPQENATINPFEDYDFGANFTITNLSFYVYGFYDGNGKYKVRFMPNTLGEWNYITWSNVKSLNGIKGQFNCTDASSSNFGVAYVNSSRSTKSFTWSQNNDAYFSVGTTSYAFIHYPNQTIINKTLLTLKSLSSSPIFNKLRFLLFPKWYKYTHVEPLYYPYQTNGGLPHNTTNWNFRKFNVTFWQHLDSILTQILTNMNNFVVDLILFHPYDKGHWGYDCMGGLNSQTYNVSNDIFYLKYAIARLASYKNVWWSMANEFNLIQCKNKGLPNTFPIWDELFSTLIKYDPYDGKDGRIPMKEKSIHQSGNTFYNYSQPYVTHFSIQSYDDVSYEYFQNEFKVLKPVILDQVQYEGNLTSGNNENDLSAAQETDRFWMANSNGNMCGHSEDLLPNKTNNPGGTTILWNNFGNILRGGSYNKIGWFYRYMINVNNHPPFDALESTCLQYQMKFGKKTIHCLISSLQKTNVFYLIHWSNYTNFSYDTTIELQVFKNNSYQLAYVDYMAESISILNKTISGVTSITFTAPQIPYNIEVKNLKSLDKV